jgi:hypothetical protein
VLAFVGIVSLVVGFFPFVSVWKGQPDIAVRVQEDDHGKMVIRGRKGDFGVMIGTLNDKHEVILQEVKVIFNPDEFELKNNDIFTDVGLAMDGRAWVEWKGEQTIQPKDFCLFVAPFAASDAFTNTAAIEVMVRASVPGSDLGFPWNMFPPPTQKAVFHIVLHWEPDETGGRAGFMLGGKEGLTIFGSAATNTYWGWTKEGTAFLRVLAVAREKKPSE